MFAQLGSISTVVYCDAIADQHAGLQQLVRCLRGEDIDDDGFVSIVDRIKELIITGGFNVAPSEVEDAIRHHPDVEDCAVIGLPDERSGEQVVVAVVLRSGASLDAESIRSLARERLTPYKVPRRVVQVDDLPRSLIGKVIRRQVKEQLLAGEAGAGADSSPA